MSETALPPINNFDSILKHLSDSFQTVYECGDDVSAVVLMAQMSNRTEAEVTVDVKVFNDDSGNTTWFTKNMAIPPRDAVSPITEGKLVLKTGDRLSIRCSQTNGADLVMSVLEVAER